MSWEDIIKTDATLKQVLVIGKRQINAQLNSISQNMDTFSNKELEALISDFNSLAASLKDYVKR
tara:strand:+ start:358 stop:549 length:192 start_codon:yes stop_codon:yes gene_type:complete